MRAGVVELANCLAPENDRWSPALEKRPARLELDAVEKFDVDAGQRLVAAEGPVNSRPESQPRHQFAGLEVGADKKLLGVHGGAPLKSDALCVSV